MARATGGHQPRDANLHLVGLCPAALATRFGHGKFLPGDLPGQIGALDQVHRKVVFAVHLAEFVQRQLVTRRPGNQGIRVDPDSGEVWVGGAKIPTLTNLEYRLLLLLYGRLGKICTKYEVVEAVWGEEYIDEVDDARIEKLVSRLRQKIEPDIANPRYVLTIRGRGYKLVEG